ncbi:MAG: SDR family oxidoreductase [Gemmatimonadota bacterium]|nr:SDR family oxidoreductase [Gemmatimonadota bacterium]
MTTVLVTGASGGIGLAIAKRFAADGYDLVLVARASDRLAAVASELGRVRVDTIAADLATPGGADAVAAAVAAAGWDIDILVNNAGAGLHGAFATTPLERELQLIQLNVSSLVQLTKRLLPGMLTRRRGRIVNIASVAAFLPGPFQSVYYATKAFVLSFSEALAEELRGTGVGVTTVCPGPTVTGFHEAAQVRRARPVGPGFWMTADAVAEATVRAVRKKRRLVVPGIRQRVLVWGIWLLPRWLVARVARVTSEPAGT